MFNKLKLLNAELLELTQQLKDNYEQFDSENNMEEYKKRIKLKRRIKQCKREIKFLIEGESSGL